jgi:hypothetical protein
MSRTVKEEDDAEVAQRAAEVSLRDAAKYRARVLGLAPSECIMIVFIGTPLHLCLWYSMFVLIGTTIIVFTPRHRGGTPL